VNAIPNRGIFAPTLTNPDSQVFIMKAANLVDNPTSTSTTKASLKSLGDPLQPPDGWSYNVVQLTDDL
jgi:hypothetical protein